MVRFHTVALALTWAAACGPGSAGPSSGPAEPPPASTSSTPIASDTVERNPLPEVLPPPKLACTAGATPQPAEPASWYCTRADGVRHGPFVRVFPDGSIAVRGSYAEGQLDGAWVRHHGNGAVAERGAYVAGKKDGSWQQLAASGAVLGEYAMSAGSGVEKRWYETGTLYSETALRSGVRHGTAKVFAADRGTLEIAKYVDGKLDGSRTSGTQRTVRIEESFQRGIRHGIRKIWQFTVLLAEEEYDRAGRLHGTYTLWRNRKIKRVTGAYEHGQRIGAWVWRDRSDKVEREGSYARGKKTGTWRELADGKLVFTGQYTDGKPDGEFVYRDRRGNELGSFRIAAGTGTMLTFHANKKPSTKQQLVKGVEDGLYQVLTPRGKVLVEGSFKAGAKHGVWKELTVDGTPVLEQTWARGKLDGSVKKYVDGKLATEAQYRAGKAHGAYVEYREGQPVVTGSFEDDLRSGTWTHKDPDGNVVLLATYRAGVLEGAYRQLTGGFVLAGEMRAGRRSGTWTKTDKAGVVRTLVYATP